MLKIPIYKTKIILINDLNISYPTFEKWLENGKIITCECVETGDTYYSPARDLIDCAMKANRNS